MPFQLKAKKFFLTYSQVNVDACTHEGLRDFLIGLKADVVRLRVGYERHADGGSHYHAYIEWDTPFRSVNERVFDYAGFHPNIVSPRKPVECWNYCGKEGVVLDVGDPPVVVTKRTWTDTLSESVDKADFFKRVKEDHPRDFVLSLERIEYFANYFFKAEVPPYVDPYNGAFTVPNVLDEWVANNLQADNVGKLGDMCTSGGPAGLPPRPRKRGS